MAAASSPLSPVGGLLLHLGLGSNPTTPVWVQHHHHHHGRPWHQADYIPPGQVGNILPNCSKVITHCRHAHYTSMRSAMVMPWNAYHESCIFGWRTCIWDNCKKLLWEAQYLKLPTASTMVQVTIELGRIERVLEDSGKTKGALRGPKFCKTNSPSDT